MICFLDIDIDTKERSVFKKGERIKTSTLNFDLLVYFAQNPNKIISRSELLENVWRGRIVSDSTVYKQVKRLKEGFLTQLTTKELIQTIHGQGFMFTAEVGTRESPLIGKNENHFTFSSARKSTFIIALSLLFILIFVLSQLYAIKKRNTHLNKKIERMAIVYHEENEPNSLNNKDLAQVIQSQLLVSDFLSTRLEKSPSLGHSIKQNSTTLIQDLGYDSILNMRVFQHEKGVKAHVFLRSASNNVPMQNFEAKNLYLLVNQVTQWVLNQFDSGSLANRTNITTSEIAFNAYIDGIRLVLQNQEEKAADKFQLAVKQDPEFWIAWNALAVLKRKKGEVKEALSILDKINLQQASKRLAFLVNNTRATSYYRLGQLNKAVAAYNQALDYARSIKDTVFIVSALINQSYMYSDLNQANQARNNLEEALLYIDKKQQKTQLAALYSSLASLYRNNLYDTNKALHYAELSYDTFRSAGNDNFIYVALNNWADILFQSANYAQAEELYKKVLKFSDQNKRTVNGLYALKALIEIQLFQGKQQQAEEQINIFQHTLASIDNPELAAELSRLKYLFAIKTNNNPAAFAALQDLERQVLAFDNPMKKQNYYLLKFDYNLHTNAQKINSTLLPALEEQLTEGADLNYIKSMVSLLNGENNKAEKIFQDSIDMYSKRGQLHQRNVAIDNFLSIANQYQLNSEFINKLTSLLQ